MKIETAILRRLGPIPYWRGERRCLDSLETIYRRVVNKANDVMGKPMSGTAKSGGVK